MYRMIMPLRSTAGVTSVTRNLRSNLRETPVRTMHNRCERSAVRIDLPPLMEFDFHRERRIFLNLKLNWFLKPFIDKDFDVKLFGRGALQAIEVISSHLSNDRLNEIKPIVTEQAFREVESTYRTYSTAQKLMHRVDREDIENFYVNSVDIDMLGPKQFKVKIIVFADVIHNRLQVSDEMRHRLGNKKLTNDFWKDLPLIKPILDHKFALIYGFSRDYHLNGQKSDWIVDRLAHIKATDALRWAGFID